VSLEDALMDFARALMQALRTGGRHGSGDGEQERHAHRHHHHHGHHHGGVRWGDPAERVEMLGRRFGATDVAATAAAATPAASNADPVSASATDLAVQDETSAAPVTSAAPQASEPVAAAASVPQSTTIFVATINFNGKAPGAPMNRVQENLLSAFDSLQQALGRPAGDDKSSLKEQLTSFLQALAQRLRGDEEVMTDTVAPGALLSTTA
jgi:hypothetical protein